MVATYPGLRGDARTDWESLNEWADEVRRHLPDAIILLFGSRARGEGRPDSDYDLCVVSGGFAAMKPWDRALRVIELWTLDAAVEVVAYTPEEWDRVSGWTFPRTIRAEGVVIEPSRGGQAEPREAFGDPHE